MKQQTGFTLVEAMIVVAIIGIISAIAYPSYQDYVRKSKRSDAFAAVAQAAADQERRFAMNNRYVALQGNNAINSPEGYYTVTVTVNGNGTTYTATANAVAGSSQDGDSCDGFSVTNTGRKQVSTGTLANCWP